MESSRQLRLFNVTDVNSKSVGTATADDNDEKEQSDDDDD